MSSRCTGFEAPAGLGRRRFLERFGLGLGSIALADLINPTKASAGTVGGGVLPGTHFPARAKRVIYLFQSGAPSQIDLYEPKPLLNRDHGKQLPASVRGGQR